MKERSRWEKQEYISTGGTIGIPPSVNFEWQTTATSQSIWWNTEPPTPDNSGPGEGEWQKEGQPEPDESEDLTWEPYNETGGFTRERDGTERKGYKQKWRWFKKVRCPSTE